MGKRRILVLNSGSSSLKFKLFKLPRLVPVAQGLVEDIGGPGSEGHLSWEEDGEAELLEIRREIGDHAGAIGLMSELFETSGILTSLDDLAGIGHRVVHGGERFRAPTLVDSKVLEAIRELIPLAPLHNPANLMGIEVALDHAPSVPQVAVFDTAFHQTIPDHAYLYALPHEIYTDFHVRRYGFHGTSHGYVAKEAARQLDRPIEDLSMITLHLGNGASATAIKAGRSLDTSMGFTPLEGLIMGTRSGDLDPAILFYLAREHGLDLEHLDDLLNRKSGLKGICGQSDMRAITRQAAAGDRRAELAISMFCYRIKKYIGAYMAVLGGLDCLVFTGGIGENSQIVRQRSCRGLEGLGIVLDEEKNRAESRLARQIQAADSRVKILVIPTDEELEIAAQTIETLECES